MAITRKQHYRGSDFNNKDLKDAKSLQLNQDAANADEAVRLSQSESIADQAAQDILVENGFSASNTTAFTSASLVSFLAAKQDNLSIHSSSTAFAEFVNGTELKIKRLVTNEVAIDSTSTTLASCLGVGCIFGGGVWAVNGVPLQVGDVLILENATSAQERSWILNGNTNGDAGDFTRLQTDYDESVIKAMFSGSTFLDYDANAGVYTLRLGIGATQVGAQTLPMDSTKFSVLSVAQDNQEKVNLALESLIVSVDNSASSGSATLGLRLDNLSGVTGSNLGSFNGSTFSDNQSIKQVLQESETKHETADADRAAVRSEFASADTALDAKIDAETVRALSAEASESSARQSSDNALQNQINGLSSSLASEAATRLSADNGLDARLDVVEGDSTTAGSIAFGVQESKDYADSKVALEALARQQQDAVLNLKIDNLAEGDITFVGQIDASGDVSIRQDRISAGDTRNGQDLMAIDLLAGETFVFSVDASLTYTDGSTVAYEAGDKIMLVDDVASGSLVEAKINAVPANATGLSVINIGSSTIEIDGSDKLGVIGDSITRTELAPGVEADIDDKRSLTADNAITSDSDTHFVTDTTDGAAQNIYYKRTSNTSDALTDTKRAILAELFVASNGSGNPLAPSFAHTGTFSTHYNGTSTDMSMAIGGGNFEANVTNPTAAVYSTGVYALAQSPQLGINSAVTGVAQNAGISNIGITGFGKAGGVGKDRGGVFALSDLDFLNYAGFRSASPISYPDVALLADAGTSATGKSLVSIGDAIFEGGSVTVPGAVTDTDAVNLGDIKATEFSVTVTIGASSSEVINHGLGTKKIMPAVWVDDELATSAFDIERAVNSLTIYNDTDSPVTCEVLIKAFK